MKKSFRAARMERHHKRFGSGGLNLVSLMDIFTILVFFLLVNSSNVQQLPSSKSIELPQSSAQQLPQETVIVLVNNQQILVQGLVVTSAAKALQIKGNIIPELLAEMKLQSQNSWQTDQEEGLKVTVMGDKEIPYKLLRKILATLSQADYTNISMAVMKRPEPKTQQSGTR